MAIEERKISQSGATCSRSVEKILDESQYTGIIDLSGHKLTEYPDAGLYDLSDTTAIDLSKNDLVEIPYEVYSYWCLESLDCYHNSIKCLPENISDLQNLVFINLSRNQLTVLPTALCYLPCLEILLVSHNRLISLPEEVRHLGRLMELDVSSNELCQLPTEICFLALLRVLKVRGNKLVELPKGFSRLQLQQLDISCNFIPVLPVELSAIGSLEVLRVEGNPLTFPPASICARGLSHVMKQLLVEASQRSRSNSLDANRHLASRNARSGDATPCAVDHNQNLEAFGKNFQKTPTVIPQTSIPGSGMPSELDNLVPVEDDGLEAWQQSFEQFGFIGTDRRNSKDGKNTRPHHKPVERISTRQKSAENKKSEINVGISEPVFSMSSDYIRLIGSDLSTADSNSSVRNESIVCSFIDSPVENFSYEDDDSLDETLSGNDNDSFIETEIIHPRSAPCILDVYSGGVQQRQNGGDRNPVVNTTGDEIDPDASMNPARYNPLSDPDLLPPLSFRDKRSAEDSPEEYQRRHEAFVSMQRREAYNIQRRLEQEKERARGQQVDPGINTSNNSASMDMSSLAGRVDLLSMESNGFEPFLTIRRSVRHIDEGFVRLQQLRKAIYDVLKIDLPDDLSAALSDGVVLCHLANHLHTRSVSKIHVPTSSEPVLPLTKRQKNVDRFLAACRTIGVDEEMLCSPAAILECSGTLDVASTVRAMMSCSSHLRHSAV